MGIISFILVSYVRQYTSISRVIQPLNVIRIKISLDFRDAGELYLNRHRGIEYNRNE